MIPTLRSNRRLLTLAAAVGATAFLAACQTTGADSAQNEPVVTKPAPADAAATPKKKRVEEETTGRY